MWAKKLAAMFVAALMVFSAASPAFAEYTVKDGVAVVKVTGYGVIPKNSKPTSSFGKSFARQAAQIDAYRNFTEQVYDLLRDRLLDDDVLDTALRANLDVLQAKIRNSENKFDESGNCQSTMEIEFKIPTKK